MEDNYKKFAEVSIAESIDRCVKVYGIEGTEDLIERVLSDMDGFREVYLQEFHKKYSFLKRK